MAISSFEYHNDMGAVGTLSLLISHVCLLGSPGTGDLVSKRACIDETSTIVVEQRNMGHASGNEKILV